MTETYDKSNSGALFKNDRKESEEHADYRGEINVAGVDYWIDGWMRVSKKGTRFMSLRVKSKQKQATKPQFDDAIEF